MKTICVYCGSRPGSQPNFMKAANTLGGLLADNNIQLVYGGAKIGLMGAVADGSLQRGGKVLGVQPKFLERAEIIHQDLTDYVSTGTMHERKFVMYEKADAFIALPGGLGTFDELFEILTWRKLGIHMKPVGIVNVDGYFNRLVELVKNSVEVGLSESSVLEHFFISDDPKSVLESIIADSNF